MIPDAFRSNFHYRVAEIEGLPSFVGGAIGYAGYDVVRYVEELPNAPEDDRGLPDLDFSFTIHLWFSITSQRQ